MIILQVREISEAPGNCESNKEGVQAAVCRFAA